MNESTLESVWAALLQYLSEKSPLLAGQLKQALPPAIFGPNALAIRFHSSYNLPYESCRTEQNIQKLQEALKKLLGKPVTVRIDLVGGPNPMAAAKPAAASAPPPGDRKRVLQGMPFFKQAVQSLGAQIWHVDEGFNPVALPAANAAEPVEDDNEDQPPDIED